MEVVGRGVWMVGEGLNLPGPLPSLWGWRESAQGQRGWHTAGGVSRDLPRTHRGGRGRGWGSALSRLWGSRGKEPRNPCIPYQGQKRMSMSKFVWTGPLPPGAGMLSPGVCGQEWTYPRSLQCLCWKRTPLTSAHGHSALLTVPTLEGAWELLGSAPPPPHILCHFNMPYRHLRLASRWKQGRTLIGTFPRTEKVTLNVIMLISKLMSFPTTLIRSSLMT